MRVFLISGFQKDLFGKKGKELEEKKKSRKPVIQSKWLEITSPFWCHALRTHLLHNYV